MHNFYHKLRKWRYQKDEQSPEIGSFAKTDATTSSFLKLGLLLFLLLLATIVIHIWLARITHPLSITNAPKRIVSLAPSITETLFALNLGDNVVGVTRFCNYPPQAQEKPKVAGFSDVNYEAVIRSQPDLVALPIDKEQQHKDLERLGVATLVVDTRSLTGLMDTIAVLGKTTNRTQEADAILNQINHTLKAVKERAQGQKKPRVLISVMHDYDTRGIKEINIVGKDGFYSEMINAAGGQNSYEGNLAFPRLSYEAILFLNPDVIIDIVPPYVDINRVRQDWQAMTSVNAIKYHRLYLFNDAADSVPGPRFYQTLTKLSDAFYPAQRMLPGTNK